MNELDSTNNDKYNDIFEAVLSAPDSELYSRSVNEIEAKSSKTAKRQHTFDNTNLKLHSNPKKRKETTKDRLIEWNNFYSETKFGIWIQCTKCNKWRRVFQYEEEHEVPKDWHCSMNASGISGCDDPENVEPAEFSPVDFIPGSIVWAKLEGHPWWPGMVEDDPDTEEFYWASENGTWWYNVTFLDDKVSHAWIPASFVCSFLKPPRRNGYLKRKYMKNKHTELIDAAEKKAKTALTMSIKERLKNFSFAHRYEGKWPRAENLDDDTTTDIMEMIKEVEDIESLKSFDSDAIDNSIEQSTVNEIKQEFSNHEQLYTHENSKCNENKNSEFPTENFDSEIKQNDITFLTSINKKSKIQPLKKLSGSTDNKSKVKSRKIADTELCLDAISFPQKNNYRISIQKVQKCILYNSNETQNGFKSTTNEGIRTTLQVVSKKNNFQVETDKMEMKKNEDKNIVISQQNKKLKKNNESDKDLKGIKNVNKIMKVMKQNTKPSFKPPIKDKEKPNPSNKKKSIKHTNTENSNNIDKCTPNFNLKDKVKNCVHELSTNPAETDVKSKQDLGQVQNIDAITDHTTPIKTDLQSNNGNMEHVLCPEDRTVNQDNLQTNSKENKRIKNSNKSKTNVGKIKEKTESKSTNKKVKNEEKSEKISKQDIGQEQNIEPITDETTLSKTDLESNNGNMEHNILCLEDKTVNQENLENKTVKNSNKSKTNEVANIKKKIKSIRTNKNMKNEEKSKNNILNILNILEKNLNSSQEIESILKPVTTSTTNTEQIEVINLSDDDDDENKGKISKNEAKSFSLSLNLKIEQSENEDSDPFEAE